MDVTVDVVLGHGLNNSLGAFNMYIGKGEVPDHHQFTLQS